MRQPAFETGGGELADEAGRQLLNGEQIRLEAVDQGDQRSGVGGTAVDIG